MIRALRDSIFSFNSSRSIMAVLYRLGARSVKRSTPRRLGFSTPAGYDNGMFIASLQSGSNGNCIYVEADGVGLLFDAGISGKQARLRLEALGRDIRDVRGVFISHDHIDHVSKAGIYQRKFALPIHITEPTFAASQRHRLGEIRDVNHFRAGQTLEIETIRIETLPTAHDGVDGCAFIVAAEGKRLGICTDLGHVFAELEDAVESLDAVILESNYDPEMLEHSWYPLQVKRRIAGEGGHLSNIEAAELLVRRGRRLQWACLGHMSQDNNTPDLAWRTHHEIVGEAFPIHLATRYQASEVMRL